MSYYITKGRRLLNRIANLSGRKVYEFYINSTILAKSCIKIKIEYFIFKFLCGTTKKFENKTLTYFLFQYNAFPMHFCMGQEELNLYKISDKETEIFAIASFQLLRNYTLCFSTLVVFFENIYPW